MGTDEGFIVERSGIELGKARPPDYGQQNWRDTEPGHVIGR